MRYKLDLLYLDLIKKSLTFTLWPEPPVPVTAFNYLRRPVRRYLVSLIALVLAKRGLQLVEEHGYSDSQREEGRTWPRYADTMIGLKRLDNLQHSIEVVLRDGVDGDFIETGVWKGGACIFMRAVLAAFGNYDRKVFVADSFDGLPMPDVKRHPADKTDSFYLHHSYFAVSRKTVETNFRRYGLLDDQVVFIEGWFKESLPGAPIGKLSILRLDGDMYGSTMDSLEVLYPKLSTNGFCIIDDYNLPGCRAAVDEFRVKYRIESQLERIDLNGVYWRKVGAASAATSS